MMIQINRRCIIGCRAAVLRFTAVSQRMPMLRSLLLNMERTFACMPICLGHVGKTGIIQRHLV